MLPSYWMKSHVRLYSIFQSFQQPAFIRPSATDTKYTKLIRAIHKNEIPVKMKCGSQFQKPFSKKGTKQFDAFELLLKSFQTEGVVK